MEGRTARRRHQLRQDDVLSNYGTKIITIFLEGTGNIASLYNNDKDGLSGTAPHIEFNYGVAPNVQLHLIAPMTYSRPVFGSMQYGYGDTELGVKWRFVQESAHTPMVGIFPLIETPTGDAGRGLGTGQTSFYLPLWIQKSWGSWTTYGGGGYWQPDTCAIRGNGGKDPYDGRRGTLVKDGGQWLRRFSLWTMTRMCVRRCTYA